MERDYCVYFIIMCSFLICNGTLGRFSENVSRAASFAQIETIFRGKFLFNRYLLRCLTRALWLIPCQSGLQIISQT